MADFWPLERHYCAESKTEKVFDLVERPGPQRLTWSNGVLECLLTSIWLHLAVVWRTLAPKTVPGDLLLGPKWQQKVSKRLTPKVYQFALK